ncbi:MAG TPA: hypothetical protein VKV19_07235 [Ktedonobacteraceae bacterium]|nr:hypothetical protein [Ktedonobacteraceae bacterium]
MACLDTAAEFLSIRAGFWGGSACVDRSCVCHVQNFLLPYGSAQKGGAWTLLGNPAVLGRQSGACRTAKALSPEIGFYSGCGWWSRSIVCLLLLSSACYTDLADFPVHAAQAH